MHGIQYWQLLLCKLQNTQTCLLGLGMPHLRMRKRMPLCPTPWPRMQILPHQQRPLNVARRGTPTTANKQQQQHQHHPTYATMHLTTPAAADPRTSQQHLDNNHLPTNQENLSNKGTSHRQRTKQGMPPHPKPSGPCHRHPNPLSSF